MAMTGDNPVFVDTNILIYASIPESPLHSAALNAIQAIEQADRNIWISRQILREYLATLTRPQASGDSIPVELVIEKVHQFENRFQIAEDNPQVTERPLTLMVEIAIGRKQVHEVNKLRTSFFKQKALNLLNNEFGGDRPSNS